MCLSHVVPVAVVSTDDLSCISHCRGPIKALLECFVDKGLWGIVVHTCSSMHLSE